MDDTVDRDDPVFRTIPRDAAFLTEYDTGRDEQAIAAHADGDVYEIPFDNAAFLASERNHVYQGIGNAAKYGIIVRSGDALERLSKIKRIAFDKTGTLTYGKPRVTNVVSASDRKSVV